MIPISRLYRHAPLKSRQWSLEPRPITDIRKAFITAAGTGQRSLPLQTLVDRDGKTKTALAVRSQEQSQDAPESLNIEHSLKFAF